MGEDTDVRVELAVIKEQVSATRIDSAENYVSLHGDIAELRAYLAQVVSNQDKRITANEKDIIRLESAQKMITSITAGIQVLIGGIAAWYAGRQ